MSGVALEARIAHLEGTVEQIGDRLNGFDARFTNLERKIDVAVEALHKRIDAFEASMNARFSAIDARFTAIDARFTAIDARFAAIDARFAGIDARFAEMDRRFTWMIGLLIVSILAPIAQHFLLR